jgi:RNA polymerase sigma-70 factor (ECF subfamily)
VLDDFGVLLAENYERIFGVIYRLVGDEEEAADLTQDTFVNAWRARGSFRGDSSEYTWLYRIAVNLTRNRLGQLRRRRRSGEAGGGDPEPIIAETPTEEEDPPDARVEYNELGEVVAAAVLKLRPDYREVVILREYEQLSYEEIASVLGCSVQAVKSRLFRARGVLRKRLGPYLEQT